MSNNRAEGFFASKGFLLLMVLISFILILSFFFGDSGYLDIRGKQNEIRRIQSDIDRLKEIRDQLAQEVKELENDPLSLERTARERLWLMKKNEKVIVIIKPDEQKKKDQEAPKNRGDRKQEDKQ